MLARLHTFDALSNKNFRQLWLGQIGTGMGVWMDQVARGWLVYEMTHSPLQLGLVTAFRGLPMLLLTLPAGVIADRYPRRMQLMVVAIFNAVVSFILATLVATGRVELWHVYVTAFLAGCTHAFQGPARLTLTNDLVSQDKLMNSMALNSAAMNVSRGIGPAASGLLITFFGVAGSYYAEVALYATAALLTARIRVPAASEDALRRRAKAGGSFLTSTSEALHYVVTNRLMLGLMVLALAPMVVAMPFTSLFPIFAVDILEVGATGQGLLLSSLGVGAFSGALGVASMGGNPKGRLMLLAAAAFGVALVFFGRSPWMWFSMLSSFTAGVANTFFTAQSHTVVLMTAPDHMRGRVISVYMIDRALTPVGTALAGVLANYLGGPNAVVVMGLTCISLAAAVALLVPEIAAVGAARTGTSPAAET
ncbi:MAG: MFS transporter [Chloroflexi bacterium]|nr:MFS transporter [Chloroflexota bacterium]